MVHTGNFSTQEAKASRSPRIQDQPGLNKESKPVWVTEEDFGEEGRSREGGGGEKVG